MVMQINTKKTIEKCPYTSIINEPPTTDHAMTFYKFSFVEEGTADVVLTNKYNKNQKEEIPLGVHSVCLIRPFDFIQYKNCSLPHYTHRDIYFDEKLMKECCDFFDPDLFMSILKLEFPPVFNISSTSLVSITEDLGFLNSQKRNKKLDVIHKGVIASLLLQYYNSQMQKRVYPAWINKLLRDIEQEEFVVKPVEEMVASTFYSHGYVNREFKKYMGITLKQYVINAKLKMAYVMLSTSSLSLETISKRLHFTSVSNLVSVFKNKYGITPAKFRKQQRSVINLDTYTEWGDYLTKN